MRRQRIFWVGIILFFIVFILFSFAVKLTYLNSFDLSTLKQIQNNTPKEFDGFLSFFSLLGSFEITFVFLIGIFFLRKRGLSLIIFFIFIVTHIFEFIGKTFLTHPGPPIKYFRYDLPYYFLSSSVKPGSSYPSGHSLRIVFLFIITFSVIYLSKKIPLKLKYFLYFFLFFITLIMLYSRVSLGEHWLTDVIGGILLGISSGFFSILFL